MPKVEGGVLEKEGSATRRSLGIESEAHKSVTATGLLAGTELVSAFS